MIIRVNNWYDRAKDKNNLTQIPTALNFWIENRKKYLAYYIENRQ